VSKQKPSRESAAVECRRRRLKVGTWLVSQAWIAPSRLTAMGDQSVLLSYMSPESFERAAHWLPSDTRPAKAEELKEIEAARA
jgi:hypothetical protein